MGDLREVILAGTGGQGLGLAGVLLAQAFAEVEGKNVLQTEAYGISMRGGHSRAEILVSGEEINELKVSELDIFLAMSQEAFDMFRDIVKETGKVIVDSRYVKELGEVKGTVFSLPLTEEARKLGNENVANVIGLGALVSVSGIIGKDSVETILKKKFAGPVEALNLRALNVGHELAERHKN